MSNLQEKMIKAGVVSALRAMGGHNYEIIHTPKDANGQPTGPPGKVGTIFGLAYIKASDSYNLHIDLPGIITTDNNSPSFAGVLLCGEPPQEGDKLECTDKSTDIVKAYRSGVLWSLAIKEMI